MVPPGCDFGQRPTANAQRSTLNAQRSTINDQRKETFKLHQMSITGNIHVKVGEKKIIRLEGKSTAGYEWEADYDQELLHLSKSFRSSKDAPPGSSAAEEFTVTALKAGSTTLKFYLKRKWEDKPAKEMSMNVEITL